MADESEIARKRQVLYWRLLATVFDERAQCEQFDTMSRSIAEALGLPELILDPQISIDALVARYPALKKEIEQVVPMVARGGSAMEDESAPPANASEDEDDEDESASEEDDEDESASEAAPAASEQAEAAEPETATLRRALVFSKLLLNVFGPNTQSPVVSAQQYAQWGADLKWLEGAFDYAPGGLLRNRGGGGGGGAGTESGGRSAPISEEELRRGLASMEGDLVKRMALREVLKDNQLAAKLTPSMALVEQILRDKSNLSGEALANAKALVRRYVDELAEVLKLRVEKAAGGKLDRSVPPKRIFRNLDLKKTVWKNLTNWNDKERRLYVNQLYYRRSAKKLNPTRMIVVVDQSGSMVDAMVQSTILASIFTGLPKVDVHLMAFDTVVVDLTPWVADPLEVLLRTNLGGGTYIDKALIEAEKKVVEPKNTAMVLISDFYEGGSDQVLLDHIKALKDSGVHFIPVGALSNSGYFSVSEFFRTRLKELGMPILSGSVDKLLRELRYLLR